MIGVVKMQATGNRAGQRAEALPSMLERFGLVEKLPVTLLFGAILSLSSPGFDHAWLAWCGLVPLLLVVRSSRGMGEALLTGFFFGFAYQLLCHRWMLDLYPLTMLQIPDLLSLLGVGSMWLVESAHQALLMALFALFVYVLPTRGGLIPFYKRPYFPFLLSVPVIWVFLNWWVAPSELFLGVPVTQLAYSQSNLLPMIQVCSFGGAQLLELIILFANCAIAALLFEFLPFLFPRLPERCDRISPRGGALLDAVIVIACVVACTSFGNWRIKRGADLPPNSAAATDKRDFAPPVPVAVLQGSIPVRPPNFEAFTRNERLDRYSSLISDLGVALIVLPEAVVHLDKTEGKDLTSRLKGVCISQKKEILTGTLELIQKKLVNVVRLISDPQVDECFYVKTRLLPLVESVPFNALASVIPENLLRLLPSSNNNFLEAPAPFLLKSLWGKIGASVSFELVYPELIASEVDRGASLLINVSDLAMFHNTVLAKQLVAAASLRAVENGRYLVLSSNTGISSVINPLGAVTSKSLPNRAGTLLDRVQFLHKRTGFTRMSWLWRPTYRIWWHQ